MLTELFCQSFDISGIQQNAVNDFDQFLARCGQSGQAFALSDEQIDVQFIFQIFDMLADPGLRGKQGIGHFRQIVILPNCFTDDAELLKIHVFIPVVDTCVVAWRNGCGTEIMQACYLYRMVFRMRFLSPDTVYGSGQPVDIRIRVIKSQRGADGTFHAEAAQNRLGTMMTGTYRNTFTIESSTDFFRREILQGKDSTPALSGAVPMSRSPAIDFRHPVA